jgi:hypothetical protein
MDRHAAYVALTLHREAVRLHWARDELGSRAGLTRTLFRQRAKDVTLDYVGPEGARRTQEAFGARRGLPPLVPESSIVERARASTGGKRPDTWTGPRDRWNHLRRHCCRRTGIQRVATACWGGAPPQRRSPTVEHDPAVRQKTADWAQWLHVAYRDPEQAEHGLQALLEESQGDQSLAAARLRQQTEILGRLRCSEGLFAGRGHSWSGPVQSARRARSLLGWSRRR